MKFLAFFWIFLCFFGYFSYGYMDSSLPQLQNPDPRPNKKQAPIAQVLYTDEEQNPVCVMDVRGRSDLVPDFLEVESIETPLYNQITGLRDCLPEEEQALALMKDRFVDKISLAFLGEDQFWHLFNTLSAVFCHADPLNFKKKQDNRYLRARNQQNPPTPHPDKDNPQPEKENPQPETEDQLLLTKESSEEEGLTESEVKKESGIIIPPNSEGNTGHLFLKKLKGIEVSEKIISGQKIYIQPYYEYLSNEELGLENFISCSTQIKYFPNEKIPNSYFSFIFQPNDYQLKYVIKF